MVNVRSGPDERDLEILAALRAAPAAVSGQALADRFGISRVALWKRIERLKGFSYRIQGGSRGYRLLEEDVVVPWAFPEGGTVVYQRETSSTMDEAWRLAEGGAPAGTMVLADRQSAGRGRQGRAWCSPDGGLYVTLVLRPRLPASHAACLLLEGACALQEWLESTHGCRLDFHWPNDLMAQGCKVGGLLVELAGSLEEPRFYLLGLGVNLHTVGLPDRASSGLAELISHPPLRRDLAIDFREHLLAWTENPVPRPREWENRCTHLGRTVVLQDWQGRTITGLARGFDDRGALLLVDSQSGTETAFLPGETRMVRLIQGAEA
jgi:BirA family transcriptional regulator, biotin operon repressor / biotin---[acetyl-CoA-carboxylase] ligase